MKSRIWIGASLVAMALLTSPLAARAAHVHHEVETDLRWVQIQASTKEERSEISNLGVSIEFTRSDSVWGFASPSVLNRLKSSSHRVLGDFAPEVGRGGHHDSLDFPVADARFHNYAETLAMLKNLVSKNADIAKLESIGKSTEGRDLWAIHINTTQESLMEGSSGKPGIIYLGAHHAREHLSVEMPLMFAEHLLQNRSNPRVAGLLDSRDIWIVPMVNPDGAEWDIATSKYRMWRKNRRDNKDGTFGVDLNRNYSFKWGTGGSDKDTSSDVYMGPSPFSEPETQAVRDFITAHVNLKVLLSFHTYSELILYPWGHTYDGVGNARDLQVFQKMAQTMAGWNKYKPQQASALYIASGDTTDWAYGERGIFGFTFELSPKNTWGGGGFYPGAGVIDKVFADNLQPCLYLLDAADDPYKVLNNSPSGGLNHYVAPAAPYLPF